MESKSIPNLLLCRPCTEDKTRPYVIVNTVCPGLVNTDIGRNVVRQSLLLRVFVPLWLGSLGMSADFGARIYVAAAVTREHEHVSR
jgi:NAD(P)-dependent dehydrogenase (short-subunit alcohol dehydrogenase family)